MSAMRGPARGLTGTGFRAVMTLLLVIVFWKALLSLLEVLAVVVLAVGAVVALAAALARAVLLRWRGW